MTKEYVNGKCALVEETVMRIDEVHATMSLVHQDMRYLKDISEALTSIKTDLIDVVIGKNVIPVDVAKTMIEEQRKAYTTVIRLLSWTFGIIILGLMGMKYLAPEILH
jgi:hypothetical protein